MKKYLEGASASTLFFFAFPLKDKARSNVRFTGSAHPTCLLFEKTLKMPQKVMTFFVESTFSPLPCKIVEGGKSNGGQWEHKSSSHTQHG